MAKSSPIPDIEGNYQFPAEVAIASLERERLGYVARHAGAEDEASAAKMQSRIDQVDVQLAIHRNRLADGDRALAKNGSGNLGNAENRDVQVGTISS